MVEIKYKVTNYGFDTDDILNMCHKTFLGELINKQGHFSKQNCYILKRPILDDFNFLGSIVI